MGFSEQLKKARLNKGFTQQQIADLMGITKSTYCGYETNKRHPDVAKIKQLANILDVSGDVLLETDIYESLTDETARPSWENTEVMAAVGGELPGLLERMGEQLAGAAPEVQKLAFDLLVELKHLLNQPDPAVQAAGVRLLAGCLTQCTLYLDALERYDPETGRSRPARARDQAQDQIAAALQQAMDELCPRPAKPKVKPPAQP